ncbi:MAG: outer membrane protein assembly factor BamA [Omnitrophica bacterium RIFCSPHIGHO2_02_FULL_51_18]|nr:MAG: outer membrane protein assembly factor BamA [Omnitrophica bacterium RIFCSPHIGHO2_02_FULL_51_18]
MSRKSPFFIALILITALFSGIFAIPAGAEDGKIVKAVDVRGNKTVASLTILSKVKTQVGQPVSSPVLNEDLKRLYGLGYFLDVRIEQEDFEDGIKVVFLVTEKPILLEIRFEGNNQLKKDQLKKEMQSAVGDFVDQKRLRDDLDAIRRLYEKKGFAEAVIDQALDVNPDTNQAVLRVMIDEKVKVRVKDIRIEGNQSIKTGEITGKMKTKKASWWGLFHSGFLKEEDVDEDIERIKALYDEQGFSDVEVTQETQPLEDGSGNVLLKVIVNEGKRYLVGNIQLTGNSILSSEEIAKSVKMVQGKPFSRRGLRLDVANIQDLYFEKGYLSAQIRSESLYNESADRVDLSYTITENELTYVERVMIQGNTKTKDTVIRRELRAYPGESFSGAKLKRSKERLYNLGFFEDVRFDTEEGSQSNSRNLVVTVKETKTGEFSFGGGFSSVDSVIGFAQVRQKNFDWQNRKTFTGAGQDFGLRFEIGSVRQNAELSFTEPWVFGYPYSFGFDIFRRGYNRSGTSGYFFDQTKTGFDLRLGKEFTEFDKGLLMYKLEQVKISDIPADASQDLKDEQGKNTTSSLALTLTHDQRDSVYNPSSGYLVTGTGEVAGGPLAGDKDFMKLTVLGSTYFKNFDVMVLELKGRVGFVDEFGDSVKVPIYERYFAGGANTVRGYRERRIGPRDPGNQEPIGGETFWVANAEETFPIYPDLIKGAVFFDVGNVYDQVDDFGSGDVKSGVGFGVRVKTPIGPVKVDAGYPLDDVPNEKKKMRFYFNISQAF